MISQHITVIGAGALGTAVIRGLVGSDQMLETPIEATTRTAASAQRLAELPGVSVRSTDSDPDASARAAAGADVVLLAVRPQDVEAVLSEIRPSLGPDTVLVSLAAGPRIAALQELAGDSTPVVRALPNTPTQIRQGLTGITWASTAGAPERERVRELFELLGMVVEVDEESLSTFTAVLGAQAYFYEFTNTLALAVQSHGFEQGLAQDMARQLFIGSASIAAAGDLDLPSLVRDVATPGGTTERGLSVVSGSGLGQVLREAIAASAARARELAG